MVELDAFSRKIADILSATAEERSISQSRLAAKSGVSQAQISRIFGYKHSVSLEDPFLIAEADLGHQKEWEAEGSASAVDAEAATADVDAAGIPRRLSVVDGGHAASASRARVPLLSEIEQASGNMA